ncbi:MAG: hypothetical protein RL069_2887, partial [Planctomycetota bacterium]
MWISIETSHGNYEFRTTLHAGKINTTKRYDTPHKLSPQTTTCYKTAHFLCESAHK